MWTHLEEFDVKGDIKAYNYNWITGGSYFQRDRCWGIYKYGKYLKKKSKGDPVCLMHTVDPSMNDIGRRIMSYAKLGREM